MLYNFTNYIKIFKKVGGIMEKKLVLDVNESPKSIKDWFLFSIQHVLAMLVACITVPLITGLPIGPTLIAAGVGTLIYIFTTKKKWLSPFPLIIQVKLSNNIMVVYHRDNQFQDLDIYL